MAQLLAWNDQQSFANNAQEVAKGSERLTIVTKSEFARNIVVIVLVSAF